MWIQEYRERKKLELWQFQQRVNAFVHEMPNPIEATISGELIHMLEVDKNAVTHPRIADAIATVCGATPEQRDMIVSDVHKGKWEPTLENKELAARLSMEFDMEPESIPDYTCTSLNSLDKRYEINARKVVKIDTDGKVIKRYGSVVEAAKANGVYEKFIRNRCRRVTKSSFVTRTYVNDENETVVSQCTYRYANEWDSMTPDQKIADISALEMGDKKPHGVCERRQAE